MFNPSTGKKITGVSEATPADVDRAVAAARNAYETTWGLNCPGTERGKLISKLADIMEEHADDLSAVEALDNGL